VRASGPRQVPRRPPHGAQGADSGGGEPGAGEPAVSAARCSLCFFCCSIDWRCLFIAKPTMPPMTPAMISPAIGTQRGKGSGDPSSKCAPAANGTPASPAAKTRSSVCLFNTMKQSNLVKPFSLHRRGAEAQRERRENKGTLFGVGSTCRLLASQVAAQLPTTLRTVHSF
jgi:hypothetical protein